MATSKDASGKGEAYVENKDFTPNPADAVGTVDTTGLGGLTTDEAYPEVGRQDRIAVAQQTIDAADPDSPVSADSVIIDTQAQAEEEDRQAALEQAAKDAQQTLKDEGVETDTRASTSTKSGSTTKKGSTAKSS